VLATRHAGANSNNGLDYSGLSYTVGHGFAAVASNNGHNGTSGLAFHNNPDVVADFAGRS
jgi:feruloyl esterase